MAKKIKSPVFIKPKKPLNLGNLMVDYSSVPSSLLTMPLVQVPVGQIATPPPPQPTPPTQAEVTPYTAPQPVPAQAENTPEPYVSEQEVAPVKKYPEGSGLSAESKRQEDLKNISEDIIRRNVGPTSEEVAAARAAIGYEPRLQDIETERALALQFLDRIPQRVDLTPLMALSDAWTGSKFVNSYKAPTKGLQEKLLAQIASSAEQRRKLEDQVIDYLKVKSGEQLTKNLLQSGIGASFLLESQAPTLQKAASSRGVSASTESANKKALIAEVTKIRESLQKDADGIKAINDLMQNPTLQNLGILRTRIAKAIAGEVGNLAVQEQMQALPGTLQEDLKRLITYLKSNSETKIDPKVLVNTKDILRTISKRISDKYKEKIDISKDTWKSQNLPGVDVDSAYSPLEKALSSVEYKSDFQKFLENVKKRQQAGGTK